MFSPSRRAFLGVVARRPRRRPLLGADPSPMPPTSRAKTPPFQPNTLFLTWQRDPTTTMTVQWVGAAARPPTPTVYYARGCRVDGSRRGSASRPRRQAVPDDRLQGLPRRADRPDARAPSTSSASASSRRPTASARCRPRRPTRSTSSPAATAASTPHAVANNILAARQDPMFALIGGDLGYDNGRSVEISLAFLRNYSQAHDRPRRPADPDGRLHRQPRGRRRLRQAARRRPRSSSPCSTACSPRPSYATLDFGDYLSLVLLDTGHTSRRSAASRPTGWTRRCRAGRTTRT